MLYGVAAEAPEGRRNTGRGIAPVKADGKKAPEGRQNTLPLFWVLQGREREITKNDYPQSGDKDAKSVHSQWP